MPVRDLLSAASTQGAAPSDPNFEYNTLLLNGDGTNGAQNNTFLDSSTNNFTITRNGNTTQGSFSPYGSNWSNFFNGSSHIGAADSSAFDLGSANWTMEAWIFPTATGAYPVIASQYGNSNSDSSFYWSLGNNNRNLELFLYYGSSSTDIAATNAITLNAWNHIAAVRNGSTVIQYVNGVQVSSTSFAQTINNSTREFRVANGNASSNYYFNGYISNVRLVNGTAVYTSAFTPSTTPLTAISGTAILTCQSNRFIDNSSNNATITIGGSPSVQRFSPFNPTAPYSTSVIGGSGYFDGSGDYLRLADNSAFQLGSGDFTLETWVYLTAAPPIYDASLLSYGTTGNFNGWQLALTNASTQGRLIFSFNFSTVVTSTLATKLNSWNHVAVSRSGNTLYLFINGVLDSSNSFTATSNTGSADFAYINTSSYDPGSTDRTPTGYLCGSRLVKGTCLYTSTFTLPTAPVSPVTNTSYLLGYTNAGIPDLAMQNNLETVGNAQVSTSVKKYGTGSLAFDGNGDYLLLPNSKPLTIYSTGAFTIEGWVYFNSVSSQQYILSNWTVGADGYALATGVASFANNQIAFFDGTSWRGGSTTVTTGIWYHVAISSSGASSGTYIYLNGISQISGFTCAGTIDNVASQMFIGLAGAGASSFLNGYIDDLRITNGFNRYPSGTNFTPPTAALPTF